MWFEDSQHRLNGPPVPEPSAIGARRILRVGIVGAGFVAKYHLRSLRRVSHIEVVGIADIVAERAKQSARRHGIPNACASLDELLEVGLDALHVLTPQPTHFELCLKGLKAGCHVLVEKPFTRSVDDCERLQQQAIQQNCRILVDHSLLGDPTFRRGRTAVQSQRVGELQSLNLFRASAPPHRTYRVPYPAVGDPFREVGTHALYCVTAILGKIDAAQMHCHSTGRHETFLYDEWSVQLECENGVAQIHLSWNGPQQQVIDVRGSNGRVHVDFWPGIVLTRTCWGVDRRLEFALAPVLASLSSLSQVFRTTAAYAWRRIKWYQGMETMILEFFRALRSGRPMPIRFSEAKHIVDWTERIARQAEAASVPAAADADHDVLVSSV